MARCHVARAEATLARQHEILRRMKKDDDPHAVEAASRVLCTMEANLALLCEHLRQVELLHPQE
jgi:hypothetical protein